MPRIVRHQLRAKRVQFLSEPGVYQDGHGLHLRIRESGARHWLVRITVRGKRRDIGLGSYPAVSLEQARFKAEEVRRAAKLGVPLPGRSSRPTTFKEAFETYLAVKEQQFTWERGAARWRTSMEMYAFSAIGDRPVAEIGAYEIVDLLKPIWFTRPETSKRVLQRISATFESAILRGQRERANPCTGIARELGTGHRRVEHRRAMPYQDVPDFMQQLRAMAPTPARLCLQWLILTACRSGEARHSIWNEIVDGTWIMPAERTKMRRLHVVPLPDAAQAVLEEARRLPGACPTQALIFPGYMGSPLSDMALTKTLRDLGLAEQATVHGFRSSFRTWAAEVAMARPEVAEAALAHAVRDKVEAAYRRAAYLEERRQLMQAWASYICGRRNFLAITTLSARRRVGL